MVLKQCWFSQEALSKNQGICFLLFGKLKQVQREWNNLPQTSDSITFPLFASLPCLTVPGTFSTDRKTWGNSCLLGHDL